MRKLFCLFIIICFAALASAATVEFQGPAEVSPGDIVTLSVYSDVEVTAVDIFCVHDGETGGFSTNLNLHPSFPFYTPPIVLFPHLIDDLHDTIGFGSPPASGVILSFDYHIPTYLTVPSVITITVVDGYVTTASSEIVDIQRMTMNVIPEPITIALLGLGGLFIRRRK